MLGQFLLNALVFEILLNPKAIWLLKSSNNSTLSLLVEKSALSKHAYESHHENFDIRNFKIMAYRQGCTLYIVQHP